MRGGSIGLTLLAAATVAHADPVAPADAKQAAAVAKQGRALMKAHKYAEACPKLEASQKLAPSLTTETELAECDVKIGKLASALAAYRDVIAREPSARKRKVAVDLVAQLDQRVPRIIVNVEADAEVTLDGAPLAATAQGAPVDFGKHEIVATKPGKAEYKKSVTITDEGQVVTINAKLIDAAGGTVATTTAKPTADVVTTTKPAPVLAPAPERSHRRTYAIATMGAGGAALVTGVVFGALARSKWNAAKAICGGSTTCATQDEADAAGKLGAQAHTRATISTVVSIAGGVIAGAGVLLYVTKSDGREVEVSALPAADGGAVVVSGRF